MDPADRDRWRDPNGKQRTKSFRRKAEAKQFANRVEVEMQRRTYVDPQAGKTAFGPWAEEWLQSKINLRASSWARDESYLRNHVQPEFENVALARIDKVQVQTWVRSLVEKGLHPGTIYHCYRILRSVLEEAVDARLIGESPCRRITLPRIPKTEQRFLSSVEVERLADSVDPHYRNLIYAAVYLGCRWGELVGLKWNWWEIGAGATVAQEPEPGRAVGQRCRSQCETDLPNSHIYLRKQMVGGTGIEPVTSAV